MRRITNADIVDVRVVCCMSLVPFFQYLTWFPSSFRTLISHVRKNGAEILVHFLRHILSTISIWSPCPLAEQNMPIFQGCGEKRGTSDGFSIVWWRDLRDLIFFVSDVIQYEYSSYLFSIWYTAVGFPEKNQFFIDKSISHNSHFKLCIALCSFKEKNTNCQRCKNLFRVSRDPLAWEWRERGERWNKNKRDQSRSTNQGRRCHMDDLRPWKPNQMNV